MNFQSKTAECGRTVVIIPGINCATERLVQYLITEENLDMQHVLSLLCLVSKQQTHCVQAYFVPNVLQEYFEINMQVSIDGLLTFCLSIFPRSRQQGLGFTSRPVWCLHVPCVGVSSPAFVRLIWLTEHFKFPAYLVGCLYHHP